MSREIPNNVTAEERLDAVRTLCGSIREGVQETDEVNNHVHSTYSFSPFSPTMIAVEAARAGLKPSHDP
ncbi:hypothetical protein ACFL1V_07580 [Pseudomonadota bacterium]